METNPHHEARAHRATPTPHNPASEPSEVTGESAPLSAELAAFAAHRHEWICLLCHSDHHRSDADPEWIDDGLIGVCPSCAEPAVMPVALRSALFPPCDDNDQSGAFDIEALADHDGTAALGIDQARIDYALRGDTRWSWDDRLIRDSDLDDIDSMEVDLDLDALDLAEFGIDDLEWEDDWD